MGHATLRWCFLCLRCLLRLLSRKLITVIRHDCMERRYKMERYGTVFMNAADRNDTWGTNQAKNPKYPSAVFRKCLEIFIQMGKRHWSGCRTSERTVLVRQHDSTVGGGGGRVYLLKPSLPHGFHDIR